MFLLQFLAVLGWALELLISRAEGVDDRDIYLVLIAPVDTFFLYLLYVVDEKHAFSARPR